MAKRALKLLPDKWGSKFGRWGWGEGGCLKIFCQARSAKGENRKTDLLSVIHSSANYLLHLLLLTKGGIVEN
jgi:hypothetical protein